MPRRRDPPGGRDRRLADEVLYLHSLWRRGPTPAPPRASVSLSGSVATGRRANQRKRRRVEHLAEAAQDSGTEWPLWPSSPPPAQAQRRHPPDQPSPGSLSQPQQAALRAAEQFFSTRRGGGGSGGSDDDEEDEEGSESEGEEDEEEAMGFFLGLFERDAALRGHYERSWEGGAFRCMACAGRKARAGKARRFAGCVGLVQHARAATRCGRPRAHRALAAAVCRVLGWDLDRLPSVVIDPRGTLGHALSTAAAAQEAKENADANEDDGSPGAEDAAKEDGDTAKNGSSIDVEDVCKNGENACSLADGDAMKVCNLENVGTAKSGGSSSIDNNEEEGDAIDDKYDHAKRADDNTRDLGIISLENTPSKGQEEEHANNLVGGDT